MKWISDILLKQIKAVIDRMACQSLDDTQTFK